MGGQRQILSNQIEGSRKFNGIFLEKRIAAQAQDVGEYFNTPIWSTGAEKTHISDHSTNTKTIPIFKKVFLKVYFGFPFLTGRELQPGRMECPRK